MLSAREAAEGARTRRWARDARLKKLGFASYREYIRSPRWHAARKRYLQSDRPKSCVVCDSDVKLCLHHVTYKNVGNERPEDLAALCLKCHNYVHDLERVGYIESLDPAAINQLRDSRRVFENKTKAQRQERARISQHTMAETEAVRLALLQLRAACRRAEHNGLSPAPIVKDIEAITQGIYDAMREAA